MKLDHGAILRNESGLDTPKLVRFLIGNPLIMGTNGKARSRRWARSGRWIVRSGHRPRTYLGGSDRGLEAISGPARTGRCPDWRK